MEINLENAFLIAIKLSLGPFVRSFNGATQKLHEIIKSQAIKALEEPLITTLLCSCILIMTINIITISILITAAVLCAVFVIIIVEGFILGAVFAMAAAISVSIFSAAIIVFGVFSPFKRNVNHALL